MGPLLGTILGTLASSAISTGIGAINRRASNRYNSPAAQLDRLREANISPTMFYNSGRVVNADVGYPTPNIDPTLGVAKGIEGQHRLQALSLEEKMAEETIKSMRLKNEGQIISNDLHSAELERYHLDRDFNNQLKARRDYRDERVLALKEEIDRQRIDLQREALTISRDRLEFDEEKYMLDHQLAQRQMQLNEAKSEAEIYHIYSQAALDWARYWIAKDELDISEERLQIEWLKYESDYALMEAINSAFEGELDWRSITKATADGATGLLRALQKLIK